MSKNKNTKKPSFLKRIFTRNSSVEVKDPLAEETISPGRQKVRSFFERKLAVAMLVVVIFMFLLAFLGPVIWPLDVNYTERLQQNVAPGFSMMRVPSELKGK